MDMSFDVPPPNISGDPIIATAAELALSNPTPILGQQVVAWDVPMTAYGDGVTAWVDLPKIQRPPLELGYAQTDVFQNSITAMVPITGLASLAFTVTDYPVYVCLWEPAFIAASAALQAALEITNAADTVLQETFVNLTTNQADVLRCVHRLVSPGDYVVKGQVRKSTAAGTGVLSRGTGSANQITRFIASENPILLAAP